MERFHYCPRSKQKNLLLIVIASRIVNDNGALTTCSIGTFKHTVSLIQRKAKLYAREQGMQAMLMKEGLYPGKQDFSEVFSGQATAHQRPEQCPGAMALRLASWHVQKK